MDFIENLDLEHWEKVAKSIEFFGALALAIGAYFVGAWRHHRENRPRAKIAALEAKAADFAKLLGELTNNVASNSGNIDDLTEQVAAIQGDNERALARIRDGMEDRITKLDDRMFELAGGTIGAERRRRVTATATSAAAPRGHERRNDPRH